MDKNLKKYIKQNYIKPKKHKRCWFIQLFKRSKNRSKCKMACSELDYSVGQLSKLNVDFEKTLQETFVQHLFKLIDQKGIKDSECYKRANLDRKLFSKIRSNINYKPSKNTVLALAVALELNLIDTINLLEKAGFTLSKSILTDVIVEYYITNKQFNIYKINETLYDYKLAPLGSNV